MNVVLVMLDSLRRDFVGAYGNEWVITPHLDRLSAEGATFDEAYVGSYPTGPERTDLFTGNHVFPHRGWTPIPEDERTLAAILGHAGYATVFVGDRPGLMSMGTGFQEHHQIRGQEGDRVVAEPLAVELPCAPEKLRSPDGTVVQFLRNIASWTCEEDTFPAQTFTAAIEWLRASRAREPFFLCVDSFDPHEPWVAPSNFLELYGTDYAGEAVFYPRYGVCDTVSPAELEHAARLYAAEITLVDKYVGRMVGELDYLGLSGDTLVVVLADHGFYLGEHGLLGKPFRTPDETLFRRHHGTSAMPLSLGNLYREVTRTPLWLRHPDGLGAGERIGGIAQHVDVMPTVLELCGVDVPEGLEGRSLVGLLSGEAGGRKVAFSSRCACHAGDKATHWDNASTVTDGVWSLILHPGDPALDNAELYGLAADPHETTNALAAHPAEAQRLQAAWLDFLRAAGIASKSFDELWAM